MTPQQRRKAAEAARKRARRRRFAHEAEGGASGAIVGAVFGIAAGPHGALAGGIIGAVAGILAGAALDTEAAARQARTRALDDELGINGGDIGAANFCHRAANSAAYTRASSGVPISSRDLTAEGPISVTHG
jgi:uncharacterized protein YcfJ